MLSFDTKICYLGITIPKLLQLKSWDLEIFEACNSLKLPYWEVLEICFKPVWLEQALGYTMTVFISANGLVMQATQVENFK